jgi:FtsZ-binding cell division protein ZapB
MKRKSGDNKKTNKKQKRAFDGITGVNIYSNELIENTRDLVSIYPELVKEADSLKSKNKQLERKCEKIDAIGIDFANKNTELKEKVTKLESENKELKEITETLEKDREELNEKIVDLDMQVDVLIRHVAYDKFELSDRCTMELFYNKILNTNMFEIECGDSKTKYTIPSDDELDSNFFRQYIRFTKGNTNKVYVHINNGGIEFEKKNNKLHASYSYCGIVMETIYNL